MFWELGPFEYRSYKEVAREGLDVGAGLVKLGLGKGDKMAIYADTSYPSDNSMLTFRANWQLIAQGGYLCEFIDSSGGVSINAYRYGIRDSRRRRSCPFPQRNKSKSDLSRS